jgi:Domain of unknown function (DUF4419)
MTKTTTQGTTFAVDDVPAGTKPLPTEKVKASVEKLLGTPVEACDGYVADVVEQPGFHTLIAAADLAYQGHFPLVLNPDVIWLTIAQGFARHIANNAEELRTRIVTFEGKATVEMRRDDFVRGSPENPWPEVWPTFCDQIREYIGGEAHALVLCDFSTTGPTERAASEVVLMDAVQSYFEYSFMSLCGIPAVTLEGTVEDWEKVRERLGLLGRYDLSWWTEKVEPIIDEFVKAAKGNPTPSFWKHLYKENNDSGGPYISGWLVRLLPYLKNRDFVCKVPNDDRTGRFTPWRTDLRNFMLERPLNGVGMMFGLKHDQLPSSVSAVPFAWHYHKETFEYQFLAGVMAVTQDSSTGAIRPRIGWAVRPIPTRQPKSVWDRESP